jgi:hypothetical protein
MPGLVLRSNRGRACCGARASWTRPEAWGERVGRRVTSSLVRKIPMPVERFAVRACDKSD